MDMDNPYIYAAPKTESINYYLIFLIVLVGVTLGNLLSNWVTANIAAHQAKQMLLVASQEFETQSQIWQQQAQQEAARLSKFNDQQKEAATAKRTRDATGQALWRTCMEWSEAAMQLKSQTAYNGSKSHCQRYETYVKTGKLTPEFQH